MTGTDTGVGKTFVTVRLVEALRAAGIQAIALKPVETGWDEPASDAVQLARASGRSLSETLWRHFELPAAPHVAARAEGSSIEPDELREWVRAQSEGAEVCLVEGAGGLLVPFTERLVFRDLIRDLQAETLVVARAGLGTINHSLLTLEALGEAALALAMSVRPEDSQVAHSNADQIRGFSRVPIHLIPEDLNGLAGLFHVERATLHRG